MRPEAQGGPAAALRRATRTTRRRIAWSCGVVAGYWAAAFAPFEWDPPQRLPNGAVVLADGGLRFLSPGIARTPAPPAWLDAVRADGRLRVEVDIELAATDPAEQHGPARILTVSRDYHHANLTIAQQGRDLIVRLRRPSSDASGEPAYRVPEVFATAGPHHCAVDVEPGEVLIEVDGTPRVRAPLPDLALAAFDESFSLSLGNEWIGGRPWLGTIHRAVVEAGGAEIDYLEPGRLARGTHYWLVPERLVEAQKVGWHELLDVLVNVLGFAPLGFAAAATARRPRLAGALLATALLSGSMELGQFGFAGRVPSALDFFANLLGAGLGAMAAGARLRPSARRLDVEVG